MSNTRNPNPDHLKFSSGALVNHSLPGTAFSLGWMRGMGAHGPKRKNAKRLAKPSRPLDDCGTRLCQHLLQRDRQGVRHLHFSGEDLYNLVGSAILLKGVIRVFKRLLARATSQSGRSPVRFETALTKTGSLPHGQGTHRAEAIYARPPGVVDRNNHRRVFCDASGGEGPHGECTLFCGLLRYD